MKKIKILDDLESMRATALLYDINHTMFDMFGYIYNEDRFSENNGNYLIDGYSFAKESCEIIEIDDRPILSDEQPNYLEQANEIRKQIGNYYMSNEPNTDLLRMIVKRQDLILKHLESKEVG